MAAREVANYAGHIEGQSFQGIFYDEYSHYYIDGLVLGTGNLLCLAYDEEQRKYYELKSDGRLALIKNSVRDEEMLHPSADKVTISIILKITRIKRWIMKSMKFQNI